jgi:hypothetical protein
VVLEGRRALHRQLQGDLTKLVECHTERAVEAFIPAVSIRPSLVSHLFLLAAQE